MIENTINDDRTVAGGGKDMILAGRYHILRQLGQGGMGAVWLAEDCQLDNRKVAIKMLPPIIVTDKRAYDQLKGEALVSLKLIHPNIVTLRAFEENDGAPFLVMDYIDGRPLSDYLAVKGKLSESETIKLLKPIADALDYAHGEKVIHRDVKPSNIIIRKDGHPFILDFGIAREIQESMTRVTGRTISGTLLYMSPEQLRGAPPAPAQDVYSFAAMVYECLSGDPPFTRGEIAYQIVNVLPMPLKGEFSIANTVMQGLSKRPEKRPKSCSEVVEVHPKRMEPHHHAWGHVFRDVALLVGGFLASAIGSAMLSASTIISYFNTKGRIYYETFGQASPNAGQCLMAILGLLINVAGALSLYIAVGALAKRFGAWRSRNKFVGTILAIVICIGVLVGFALKTSATGRHFGIWDYMMIVAIFGGIWRGGKQDSGEVGESASRAKTSSVRLSNSQSVDEHRRTKTKVWLIVVFVAIFSLGGFILVLPNKNRQRTIGDGFDLTAYLRGNDDSTKSQAVAKFPVNMSDKKFDIEMTKSKTKTSEIKEATQKFLDLCKEMKYDDAAKLINSIDCNNVDVQSKLGMMYAYGNGVETNQAESFRWYRKAAEQGNARAQSFIGARYWEGSGVVKNAAEAVKWWRRAAEQGNAAAQFNMGLMYGEGCVVVKNEAVALKWYLKAAEQGDRKAQRQVGVMYEKGSGVLKNEQEALKWYLKAAEQGDRVAQRQVGVMYAVGKGVKNNECEAVRWYRKAAEQGDLRAQVELGGMYESGRGVVQDKAEALKWYRKAADQGDIVAKRSVKRVQESIEKEKAGLRRLGSMKSHEAFEKNTRQTQNGGTSKEMVSACSETPQQQKAKNLRRLEAMKSLGVLEKNTRQTQGGTACRD